MSDRVWLIEQGDYSAYIVVAVCASEAEAGRVCERLNTAENEYNQFTYSERNIVVADDVVLLWIDQANTAYDSTQRGYLDALVEPRDPVPEIGFRHDVGIMYECLIREGGPPAFVRARALTADEARKIAQDRWYQLRAEAEGIA